MATINFYLDRPDRFEKYPIFIVYQHQGKNLKYILEKRQLKKPGILINNVLKEIIRVIRRSIEILMK